MEEGGLGNWRAAKGQTNIQMLYQSQQQDPESNLYYLRARYYDPATGRFISRDPVKGYLQDPRTQNGYDYALNNPVNLSDPSGEDAKGTCLNCAIGVGLYASGSLCTANTSSGEKGFIGQFGWGGMAGVSAGFSLTNYYDTKSNNLSEMEGSTVVTGGSLNIISGPNGEVGWDPKTPGQITTTSGGIGIGKGSAEYHGGESWTKVLKSW